MDASEGTDELADLFPKLAAQGFEIVEPPRIGITASRSRPAIPARGGASTHPPPGAPTRRGRTALPIWWRCLPGWTSSDAVTAGPSPTLGRSRCTNNKVHGHIRRADAHGTWLGNIGEGPVIKHDNPESLTGGAIRQPDDLHATYPGNTKADFGQLPTVIHGPVLHTDSRASRCSNHRHC